MIKFWKRRGLAKFIGSLALGLVSGQGFTQEPDAQPATTLFTNVRIFDGKSPTLSEPVNVLVRGNLIERISKDPVPVDRHTGTTVLDGKGRTLMPGLIDAHYHMMMSTIPLSLLMTADSNYTMLRSSKAAGEVLMRGFTSVRDVGGPTFGLKRAIDEGITAGPRVWPSGATISQTSGHGDFRATHDLPRAANDPLHFTERMGATALADGVAEVLRRTREQPCSVRAKSSLWSAAAWCRITTRST